MSAQVTITQLPAAGAITGAESVPIVQNGVTVQTTTGAIAASPSQPYTYLTVTQTPQLANSRYVGVTNGLSITDGGAQGLFNITTTGALLSLVNSGTGFQVKTSSTALTSRSIAVSGTGLSIADGSGVSGDPTVSLSGQVLNFANASFNGIVVLSTAGAITSATITGTANQIDVANGTGVGGNPTLSISNNPVVPGTGGMILPVGTTGQRGSSTNGNLRYNTTTTSFEGYTNGAWGSIAAGTGVTSVAATVPTFLSVAGSPITTSGTLAITLSGSALPVLNGGTGVTTSTGSTNVVLSNSPTLVTPALGTPSSAVLTNATGLPLTTGVTGLLPVANGGSGTATPNIVAGTNITVSGTWPNQTINSAASSSGTVTSVAATVPTFLSVAGSPITTSGTLAITLSGTALPVANGGTGNATGTATINANLTGPITSVGNATSITAGAIVNADINASAAIVDTKLATISTALKVSNSATTAASANTASAIVARDASGNFAAGTITAALTGTASGNLVSGGALGTPSSGTATNLTGLPLTTGVTGNLPVTNLNSGTSASILTFWRGDGSWSTPAGAGTVTSVAQSFTGGLISVSGSPITTSGTLALTVAGTSGGVPYFSTASTWATSAALSANALVIGGGAGAAPSTTTTGTGVVTALGVNTGTAGAFVVNGGALGTPLSGTATNITGLPLTTGVTGNLPVTNLNSGTSASASTFWRGDGSWAAPTGTGTVTSVTSANANLTVATTTTTPVITIVQTPALKSATTTVDVSASAAPTTGQVLTATSSTAATWQTAASGGSSVGATLYLNSTQGGF